MAEYIEREALQKFPIRTNHCDKAHADDNFIFGIEAVLEYAEHIPTVDVAPVRHGRWETKEVLTDWLKYTTFYECSVCARGMQKIKYDFCPNCGARMDGGADNGE